MNVAVLFARADSIYKTLPGCDVYDIERDARTWPGGCPVIAHPPCRAWGRLRHFARPRADEKDLALWAVKQVRAWGGVLEHPAHSSLWPAAGLPSPADRDGFGGWTLPVFQHWFGHRAEKSTFLYIVGAEPRAIPALPLRIDRPQFVISSTKSGRPKVSKREREATPADFAKWLIDLAEICHLRPAGRPRAPVCEASR